MVKIKSHRGAMKYCKGRSMQVRKGLHRVFEIQPRWMKEIEYDDGMPKTFRNWYWKSTSSIVRKFGHMDD